MTFTTISCPPTLTPALRPNTAHTRSIRLKSIPLETRRGVGSIDADVSACTSANSGLVPSRVAMTTEPMDSVPLSAMNAAEGSSTSFNPELVISNTPTSLVEPNLFFIALSRRHALTGSPSM